MFERDGSRLRSVYGAPMASADSAYEAAQLWITQYSRVFGAGNLDLRLLRSDQLCAGLAELFVFQQFIDDRPVDLGFVKLLVRAGTNFDVVYASSQVASHPGPANVAEISAGQAVLSIRSKPEFADLHNFTTPQETVYFTEGNRIDSEPFFAWKFTGESEMYSGRRLSFFVDTRNAHRFHVRNEVHHSTEIFGHVGGNATPGTRPDVSYNPPLAMDMAGVRVSIDGGDAVFADDFGTFSLNDSRNEALTVRAQLTGRWVQVHDARGSQYDLNVTQTVQESGAVDLFFNPSPSEFTTAQVNAFRVLSATHDYFRRYATDFTAIDFPVVANVNNTRSCNAYYDGNSLNYFRAGNGCVNFAYGTILSHEYGHFIGHKLGLSFGAFGEGFADVIAQYMHNTPIFGEDFGGPGVHLRHPIIQNVQYPCPYEQHYCGNVLAGVFWRLKENFENAYGVETGREMAHQLHADWTRITQGGFSTNAAHPQTAVEVLMVDDDDADLRNGTPHYDLICAAFSAHSIPCPTLPRIYFEIDGGVPEMIAPYTLHHLQVTARAGTSEPVLFSGQIHYQVNNGNWSQGPMQMTAPNRYELNLPAIQCGDTLRYYFSAIDSTGNTVNEPAVPYSTVAATSKTTAVNINFTNPAGWTVEDFNVSIGSWVWSLVNMDQSGEFGQAPVRDYDGNNRCWTTGNSQTWILGGPTVLNSTTFNLQSYSKAKLSYARWYWNAFGELDSFRAEVSSNGGATWVPLETIANTPGWELVEFNLEDFVPLTHQMRFRFFAEDPYEDSVTEAAIDRFRIVGYTCIPTCPADFNHDGVVNSQDFFAFIISFGTVEMIADLNNDGVVNTSDFFLYLQQFFQGCQ